MLRTKLPVHKHLLRKKDEYTCTCSCNVPNVQVHMHLLRTYTIFPNIHMYLPRTKEPVNDYTTLDIRYRNSATTLGYHSLLRFDIEPTLECFRNMQSCWKIDVEQLQRTSRLWTNDSFVQGG